MEALLFGLVLLIVGAPLVCIGMQVRADRRLTDMARELDALQRRLARLDPDATGSPSATMAPSADRPAASGEAAATPVDGAPADAAPPRAPATTDHPPAAPTPSAAPGATPSTTPSTTPSATPSTTPSTTPSAMPGATPGTAESFSWENFLGGRVLLVAGLIAVLFALAFFLKVAFERQWIGPGARIVMGLTTGALLLFGGDRLRSRGLGAFGTALMGAGLGALYLSVYFAALRYGFIGRPAAFACVTVLTAGGAVLAVTRDAPLLAWLGLLGGFLAPALLGRHEDALESLALWLVLLDAGILGVLLRRAWVGLDLAAVIANGVYFAAWHNGFYGPERLPAAALVLAALVLASLTVCLLPVLTGRRRLHGVTVVAIYATGVGAFAGGYEMLHPSHRPWLAAGLTSLAVIGLVCGRLLATRATGADESGARSDGAVLDAFGLAALATAVAIQLSGMTLVPAWAALGVALVAVGRQRASAVFTWGGLIFILLAILHGMDAAPQAYRTPFVPFLRLEFLSLLSPVVALLIVSRLLKDAHPAGLEGSVFATLGLWLATPLIGTELMRHFSVDADRYRSAALEFGYAAAVTGLSLYAVAVARLAPEGRGALSRRMPAWLVPLVGALTVGFMLIVDGHRSSFLLAFNPLFAAGLAAAAAAAIIGASRQGALGTAARVAAAVFLLALITGELRAWGRLGPIGDGTRAEALFRAQVWTSAAWALYAAALVALGFMRSRPELRWAGLSVFLLTIVKVFLNDMAQLDTVYRIGSFLALGVLLVAASFLYQRVRAPPSQNTGSDAQDSPHGNR